MWYHPVNASPFHCLEIDLHMGSLIFERIQYILLGCPNDRMDLVDLVKLIFPWEKGTECEDLKEDAPDSPKVHLKIVITVSEKTLRRTVPSSRYIFSAGLWTLQASARAKVGQFKSISTQQHILRFDVPVEDPIRVHVLKGLQQLEDVSFDLVLRDVVMSAFYIHSYKFKSINSNTSASRPVGSSYRISKSLMT